MAAFDGAKIYTIDTIASVLSAPRGRVYDIAEFLEQHWVSYLIGERARPLFADETVCRDVLRAIRSARRMRTQELDDLLFCGRPQAVGA